MKRGSGPYVVGAGLDEARRLVVPAYLVGALAIVPMMGVSAVTGPDLRPSGRSSTSWSTCSWSGTASCRWVLDQDRFGRLAPCTTARSQLDDEDVTRRSQAWHAAHLALPGCLVVLAICFPDAQRKRPLVVRGALLLSATALVGWAQLP